MTKTNAYHIKLEGDNYTIGQKLGTMVQSVPGLANAHIIPASAFSKEDGKKVLKLFDRFCPGLNEEIVGFSYFHFHRIFEAVVGESVGNYLRTRRMNRAANDLIYTNKRILDIAMEYLFESQEAFTRAFKKSYKLSPGAYRKNRIDVIVGNKTPLTPSKLRHLLTGITIEPKIIDFEGALVVGIRGTSTIRENKIPLMWKEFNPRIGEIKDRTSSISGYGICEVDPDYDMTKFNEDTIFNEFVGVEVTAFSDIPEGMDAKTLKRGRYAVFTHKGKLMDLKMTYDYIWGTWIPCSGYELDMRDDFKYYDERFLGQDNELSEMDIYIPIK